MSGNEPRPSSLPAAPHQGVRVVGCGLLFTEGSGIAHHGVLWSRTLKASPHLGGDEVERRWCRASRKTEVLEQ